MRISFRLLAAGVAALLGLHAAAALAAPVKEVRVDYAYWSPESLVIKRKGWLEEAFKPQGVEIKWLFSRGSNNSLEYLNSGATDFALSASISALVARSNGQPVKSIYNYVWSEPSAIIVRPDSPYKSLADLKGKKIAATKATNPYFFLLRALEASGLKTSDVEIVHLQHPDGLLALDQGHVDAWAGLDPHMASAEKAGDRFIYRNLDFRAANVLSTSEGYLKDHPDVVRKVVNTYERARRWILANPEETAAILSDESKQSIDVIKLQLGRYDFSDPYIGDRQRKTLQVLVPILAKEGIVKSASAAEAALATLIDDSVVKDVVGNYSPTQ